MTKTIIFGNNPELIKQLQSKGKEFILATDPIKTLKAMKKLENKENYTVIGDEQSTKYLEFSKKLGYNEYSEPERTSIHEEEKSIEAGVILEDTISVLNEGYKRKLEKATRQLEEENKKLREEYKKISGDRDVSLKSKEEYDKKIAELEKERIQLKNIKQALKKELLNNG